MNFAEQLAYWYLRLNGFFPLTNFVIHREATHHEDDCHRTSDADIVAVRFPHVCEPVGGQWDDWDKRFEEWGLGLTDVPIGLIVEVKSGKWWPGQLERHLADRHWRVPYAIKRLGMFDPLEAEDIANDLFEKKMVYKNGFKVAKLFVGKTIPGQSWLHLELDEVEDFIRKRMEKYAEPKLRDRMFFDGDLIQFFAWRGSRDRDERLN